MPVEVFWYIENRVLATRLSGEVTAEEMISNGQLVNEYIKSSIRPFFLIVDQLAVTKFAPNLRDMSQGMRASPWMNRAIDHTVLVSDNRLFSFFGVVISRVMGSKLYHVTSLDAALEFIKTHFPDVALPDWDAARANAAAEPKLETKPTP